MDMISPDLKLRYGPSRLDETVVSEWIEITVCMDYIPLRVHNAQNMPSAVARDENVSNDVLFSLTQET